MVIRLEEKDKKIQELENEIKNKVQNEYPNENLEAERSIDAENFKQEVRIEINEMISFERWREIISFSYTYKIFEFLGQSTYSSSIGTNQAN